MQASMPAISWRLTRDSGEGLEREGRLEGAPVDADEALHTVATRVRGVGDGTVGPHLRAEQAGVVPVHSNGMRQTTAC